MHIFLNLGLEKLEKVRKRLENFLFFFFYFSNRNLLNKSKSTLFGRFVPFSYRFYPFNSKHDPQT